MFYALLLGVPVAWIAYTAACIVTNLRRARPLKVPVVIVPISPMNALWMMLERIFWPVADKLPFTLGNFGRYCRREWNYRDKCKTHLELGEVFVQVTPGENFLYVCEPEAICEIFGRRVDFKRPTHLYCGYKFFRDHFRVDVGGFADV